MSVKDETIKILYDDFLEFKQEYWHEQKLEWANVTFVQWIQSLTYDFTIQQLSIKEEYQ